MSNYLSSHFWWILLAMKAWRDFEIKQDTFIMYHMSVEPPATLGFWYLCLIWSQKLSWVETSLERPKKLNKLTLRYFWSSLVYQMDIHILKMTQIPSEIVIEANYRGKLYHCKYTVFNYWYSICFKLPHPKNTFILLKEHKACIR